MNQVVKNGIISDAHQVLAENYVEQPPVNIYEIAKNYGLFIEEQDFPPKFANVSGFITERDGVPHVVVNAADSPNRKNFTIAHELGHWRLHGKELHEDPAMSMLYRIPLGRLNTDPLEKQANMFAANLLVPEEMLLTKIADGMNQKDLATAFGVSEEVIGYRMEHISADQAPA